MPGAGGDGGGGVVQGAGLSAEPAVASDALGQQAGDVTWDDDIRIVPARWE